MRTAQPLTSTHGNSRRAFQTLFYPPGQGHPRLLRRIVPYNLMGIRDHRDIKCRKAHYASLLKQFTDWYKLAQKQHFEILVSFGHRRDLGNCGKHDGKFHEHANRNYHFPPRDSDYARDVGHFIQHFPNVKYYSAWNEPNNRAQEPFASSRRGAQAASDKYARLTFKLQQKCNKRGTGGPGTHACRVVAGEISGQGDWQSNQDLPAPHPGYLQRYHDKLVSLDGPARLSPYAWAFHPYNDVLNQRTSDTDTYRSIVPSGLLWLTEIGVTYGSGTAAQGNDSLQQQRVHFLVNTLARRDGITRLYYYFYWDPSNGSHSLDYGLMDHGGPNQPGTGLESPPPPNPHPCKFQNPPPRGARPAFFEYRNAAVGRSNPPCTS